MKDIKVSSIQVGVNFITLYFNTVKDKNEYSSKLYNSFKNNFEYFNIQRRGFAHQPGDVPQFHKEGCPMELGKNDWHHFHIIYPDKIKKKDWDFLYLWGNRRELVLNKGLKKEKVKGKYNDIIAS